MGRYINWNDVVTRYPDIAKIGGAEQVSSAWIYGAEAEVDARLSPKYVTPITTTPAPAIVQDLSIDLTYYKATFRQKGADKLYEYLKDRFAALLAGTLIIPEIPTAGSTGAAQFSDPTFQSAFGYDESVEWQPSEDAIDSSEARR